MTAFDNIEKAKAMWRLTLPAVTIPPDITFHRWLMSFPIEDLERAFGQVNWRYKGENLAEVDSEKVHRFVTSTLCWYRTKRRAQDEADRTEVNRNRRMEVNSGQL